MIGNIYLRSRPIRLGFLVDPRERTAVRKAIQINSTLWGGVYNPLIPVFKKKMPRSWRDFASRNAKPEEVVRGYINAYDPDILVQCSETLPDYIHSLGYQTIKTTDIWSDFLKDNDNYAPKFGVGIFELLSFIYDEHYRFSDRFRPKITIPQIPSRDSLFWAAFFGELPSYVLPFINKHLKDLLEITTPPVRLSELHNLTAPSIIFPRRVSQYQLDTYRKRKRLFRNNVVFFMDGAKSQDIADYWNLRALGITVIPVTKQLQHAPELKRLVESFVLTVRRPFKNNPKIWDQTSFIRSRLVQAKEVIEFARSLELPELSAEDKDHPYFVFQDWYPRIWDDWARDKDGANSDQIYFEERSFQFSDVRAEVQFNPIFPKFLREDVFHGAPRCANEVEFHFFGSEEKIASVIPKSNGSHLLNVISGLAAIDNEWRVGANGLVKLTKGKGTELWKVPLAQDVFFGWLGDLGWQATLSSPGIIAKNLYAQLQGAVGLLANEQLLKLLNHMSSGPSGERELSVGQVKSQLRQIRGNDGLYDFLVSLGAFTVGVKVQCPSCTKNSWFGLDSMTLRMVCPRCTKDFSAIGHVESGTWCYRTAGPFSIAGYADGAYCVLLATEFFREYGLLGNLETTSVFSFDAHDKLTRNLEADFGLLWKETKYGEPTEGVLFGECKTFDRFVSRDFSRMREIAKSFPGAILAFCTLRKELTNAEIRSLARLAHMGRKYWKNERPLNPVLVLTGNEIIGNRFEVPESWKDKGFEDRYKRIGGLLDLCDLTQQLYLGLPSWHSYWFEKIEEKRKRRALRQAVKIV